jgi:outer membrane cobalamin receptor
VLNVELKGAYNSWNVTTEQYAWNKPKYEAELNASYKIDKNFSVAANTFYEGGRYAKLGKVAIAMPDKMDINLSVNYQYDKQFSAFVKLNNLINSQYQDFYGYDVQGINFMLGAAISF